MLLMISMCSFCAVLAPTKMPRWPDGGMQHVDDHPACAPDLVGRAVGLDDPVQGLLGRV